MLECPNCKEKTIPKFKKFWLGPARSIRCEHCDCKVSIPYWSLLIVPIYLGGMLMLPRLDFPAFVTIALVIIGCIGMTYFHYRFVPLVVKLKKKDSGYKQQKICNTLIGLIYLMMTFGMVYWLLWG